MYIKVVLQAIFHHSWNVYQSMYHTEGDKSIFLIIWSIIDNLINTNKKKRKRNKRKDEENKHVFFYTNWKKQIKVTQVLIIAVTIEKLLFLTSYQASSKFLYPLRP